MAALIIGIVIATVFFASFLFLVQFSGAKSSAISSDATVTSKGPKTYTLNEVKKHNSRDDCWIIIKNKVYDVTSYVEEHPGGDTILNNAGGDSTEGFYGPQHVTRVFEMIGDYYIGDLQQ